MAENAQISDTDLIRVLGEYTAKATSAHQTYVREVRAFSLFIGACGAMGFTLLIAAFIDKAILETIFFRLILIILGAMLYFAASSMRYRAKLKTAVELAVWQLRRVYQLVSRREDLGVDVDSGTRLEMELRLSEAAFLLTSLERFDRPEKFRQFQRVGRNSPFREIEPENSFPSPTTKAASSESESSSAASPDYSASPS